VPSGQAAMGSGSVPSRTAIAMRERRAVEPFRVVIRSAEVGQAVQREASRPRRGEGCDLARARKGIRDAPAPGKPAVE